MTLIYRADRSPGTVNNLTPSEVDGNFRHFDQRTPTNHFHARAYGVVEDGETLNDTALAAMKTAMQALDDDVIKSVFFEGGHVRYLDNTWLSGVGSFRLFGNGTRLECRKVTATHGDAQSLNFGNPLFPDGTPAGGALFQSVGRGSRDLLFVDDDATDVFSVGDRILLTGYDQQAYGFPPNAKYYEWHVVDAIDSGENSLTTADPLIYDYDEGWPDQGQGSIEIGAPRVWKLTGRYPRYMEFNDVELVDNGFDANNPNAFHPCADTVVVNNTIIDGDFWPSVVRLLKGNALTVRRNIEIDKIVGRLSLVDVDCAGLLVYGTGCQILDVVGGRYSVIRVNARQASIRQATVGLPGQQYGLINAGDYWGTNSMVIEGNTFIANDELLHIVNNGAAEYFTADVGSDGSSIIFDDDVESNAVSHPRKTAQALDTGVRVYRSSPDESALVSRIGWDADNSRWILHFEGGGFSTPIEAEETFYYYTCQRYTYRNNRVIGRTDVPAIRYGAGNRQDQIVTDDESYEDS